eukprot:2357255-Pyramimonas_sp.AAC.1
MPLGGDAAMNKLTQQRGPLWQHKLRQDEAHPDTWRGAEFDVEELPLTLQNLREVVDTYSDRAGLGWDKFHPRQL